MIFRSQIVGSRSRNWLINQEYSNDVIIRPPMSRGEGKVGPMKEPDNGIIKLTMF